MVKERDVNLLMDIIKLRFVDKIEKTDVVKELSRKYSVNTTTIYRNMEEADDIIERNIELLTALTSVDLDKREFREEFDKIRKLVE